MSSVLASQAPDSLAVQACTWSISRAAPLPRPWSSLRRPLIRAIVPFVNSRLLQSGEPEYHPAQLSPSAVSWPQWHQDEERE